MNLRFQCPYGDCHARLKVPLDKAKRKIRCPKCQRKFVTPSEPGKPARLPTNGLVVCEKCTREYWPGETDVGLCHTCIEIESKSAFPAGHHELFEDAAASKVCIRCHATYEPTETDTGYCRRCATRELLDKG